ncbi:MAG TPA: inorganic phosphate transporter [Candidatus Obscuribacterales bacterium]
MLRQRRKLCRISASVKVNLRDNRDCIPIPCLVPVDFTLALVILLALYFAYTDGFQVGSSVPASAIGCRALTPLQAVALAATCELGGALLGGSAVANTVTGITSWPARTDLLPVLLAGLLSASLWNHLMRRLKQPSSSTHALFGGLLGGVFAGGAGAQYIVWGNVGSIVNSTGVCKVVLSLILSPLLGILVGYATMRIATFLLVRATTRITPVIEKLQWLTVGTLAFSHGANDSQKAMGVIMLALIAAGLPPGPIPLWVRLATGAAIALGVASMAPGIVKRVGTQIFRLRPLHGLATQTSAAGIIFTASAAGGPVSTTQVIASSVMGVGSAARLKGVHWAAAQEMIFGWLLTIPGTALLAWLIEAAISKAL